MRHEGAADGHAPGTPARDLPDMLETRSSLRDDIIAQISTARSSDSSETRTDQDASENTAQNGEVGSDEGISAHVNKRLQYDPHRENLADTVFLRAEAIPEKQMKAISIAQFIGQSMAVVLLLVEVIFKYVWTDRHYLLSKAHEWWNTVYAVVGLVAVSSCFVVLVRRVTRYRHKLWGRRRKVLVSYTMIEAVVVMLALATIIIPNIYILSQDCSWFNTLVQVCAFIHWSCWNTVFMIVVIDARNISFWTHKGKVHSKHGRDRMNLDAPIWIHWKLGINWLVFEAITIATFTVNSTKYDGRFVRSGEGRCNSFDYNCHYYPSSLALQCTLFASWIAWIVLWFYHILVGLHGLHQRPWHKYKMANTILRVQIKARLGSVIVFALCLILLVFLKINSCANYIQTWLGLGPMAAVEAATIISNMYFFMPKSPDLKEPLVQAMLQEFIWSEEQRTEHEMKRASRLEALGAEEEGYMPLFCFSTAIKSFYFAALIYEYQEDRTAAASDRKQSDPTVQGYSIEQALELYNLEKFELLVEPAEDTKVLMCWNADTVHLSFRGTASMTNVLADLQVWMSDHPPKRGRFYVRPKVHAGFLKAWGKNGLDKRVMDRIRSIFKTPGVSMENMRIHLTGHSLGGALASLAAIDIAHEFGHLLRKRQIMCYTFGAPRTGNHTFARECNLAVPETWNIMNAQDIVPRSGKFVHKYKAHGQRVIVNRLGDMLVRPTFVEFSASQSLPFQSRVQDHYLATYQASFVEVCTAQFGRKAFKENVQGLHDLINSGIVHDVLSDSKLDEKIVAEGWGGVAIFQLQNQVARGVGKLQAGAKGAVGMKKPAEPTPEAKAPRAHGQIHCHDGVCWRETADDNLQPTSSQPLTRSSKDFQRGSKGHTGATSEGKALRPKSRGQYKMAFQDTDRDLEQGLVENDEEPGAASSIDIIGHSEAFTIDAVRFSAFDVALYTQAPSFGNDSSTLQARKAQEQQKRRQSKETASRENQETQAPEAESGLGDAAAAGNRAEKHKRRKRGWHLPHLPGLPGLKNTNKELQVQTKLHSAEEDSNAGAIEPSELHLSRLSNQYHLRQVSRHPSEELPSTASPGKDGPGDSHPDDRPQGAGREHSSQPGISNQPQAQLDSLSSQSLSSVGSARSFTLEDNLRRMEKAGTLHDAIIASEAAHKKKKEAAALPRGSLHPPEKDPSDGKLRIFHHSRTSPPKRRHDRLDHSTTM